jgi:prevent-host-death family protein
MVMERTISVTEAARNFSDLVNRTYYRSETTVLVRSGVPVARIVPVGPGQTTGQALAERWKEIRHLTPDEATEFEQDIESARAILNLPPKPSWD